MNKLILLCWAMVYDRPGKRHPSDGTVHQGDRCHLFGCNRPFVAGEYIAYTEQLGDKQPVCASHVDAEPPADLPDAEPAATRG